MWRLLLRRVHTRHSARVNPLQATLHRDSILLVIVDSGRRVLVLVASILIGGAGDGRDLLGDGDLAAADRHDGGHEPISTSKHFYFRKPNQLELSRQDS